MTLSKSTWKHSDPSEVGQTGQVLFGGTQNAKVTLIEQKLYFKKKAIMKTMNFASAECWTEIE